MARPKKTGREGWPEERRRALGERLRQARERAEMTTAAVAHEAGTDDSGYRRYEGGDVANPSLPKVAAYARALKVSIAWLLGETTSELDDEQGYPAIEAYIEAHPELDEAEREELRGLRRSAGPDAITYEVVDGYRRGMQARNKTRRRPRVTE